ncbi:MAG: ABC transporter ATP-binding protein [Candidatus Hodarchaeales archaeon]|jgi:ABC-type multidrug transport system ATPase subunit
MVTVSFENLCFHYPTVSEFILKSLNWGKNDPGSIGLLGTNGCGKTTLLKLLAGILVPNSGKILINKKPIKSVKNTQNIVTFVPENAKLFLIGPTPREDLNRIINEKEIVNRLLLDYSFSNIADKKLYHLSEGQRRLIALFNAFQLPSSIILLDEPTIGLDSQGRTLLFELIEYAKHQDKIVFVSTNDSRVFPKLDELVVIQNGSIHLTGPPRKLLYELENKTEIIPNQIPRLISSIEKLLKQKLPHYITSKELNQFFQAKRSF